MNYRMIINMLGKILLIMAALMIPSIIIAIFGNEEDALAMLYSALITGGIGLLMLLIKPKSTVIYAKEGFVTVALSWVLMSMLGALPFVFGGICTSYIDAVFETASGFTTTGASILSNMETIPKGIGFWRIFIIFIGGMGVLVFVMAVLPLSKERSMHIMRAEVPGPSVGKLVSKAKNTALILYSIYLVLMVVQAILLLFGGMDAYEAFTTAMSTAGTGGFCVTNQGLAGESQYCQTVCTVFMLIFAINFNMYFYVLVGKFGRAVKNEELRWFFGIYVAAVIIIAVDTVKLYSSFGEALHHAAFNAASVYSTTGFASFDFDKWSPLSKCIILLLMICGGCAGSTAGGIKTSRVIILIKNFGNELRRLVHPKYVQTLTLDCKAVDTRLVRAVQVFFSTMIGILLISVLLISANGYDFETNISAVFACLFNVGPGFAKVGPMCNFSHLSDVSKIVLTLDMLIGRLEIWPMLMLFTPATWRRRAGFR